MIFTVANTKDKEVKVFDSMGREIKYVNYYDTETCEISFFPLTVTETGKISVLSEQVDSGMSQLKEIRTVWPGSYIEVDGEVL
jgi:hypothetical protein